MNDDTALMEIESIKKLKALYCRYLDTKDWDRWRDLFTDDFVGDTTEAGGTLISGVDGVRPARRRAITSGRGKNRASLRQGAVPLITYPSPRQGRFVSPKQGIRSFGLALLW
jgi:hypothetical protein